MIKISEISENTIGADLLRGVGVIDTMPDQFGKPYEFVRRKALPQGVLCHSGFTLKIYHMIRDDRPLESNSADNLETFICNELEHGKVDRKQSIGFAILSHGFLSISIWGKGNGLFVQTYSVEDSFPALTRKTLEQTAVACTWDSRIMYHEYLTWHDFLNTKMKNSDKLLYLKSFISGYLDTPNKT